MPDVEEAVPAMQKGQNGACGIAGGCKNPDLSAALESAARSTCIKTVQ